MVKWGVVILGAVIISVMYVLPQVLIFLGFKIVEISFWVLVAILISGIFIGISGFLPYNWGKVLRSISYLALFIGLLGIQIPLYAQFFEKKSLIIVERCKELFPPVEEEKPIPPVEENKSIPPVEELPRIEEGLILKEEKPIPPGIWQALGVFSCLFTGYFPVEYTPLSIATFFLFYFLFPFIFIFAYTYGLMSAIGIEEWFGKKIGGKVTKVMTLIISLYATRVMFGQVVLEFMGYGMWGLAGIFFSIFIVKGLEHLVSKWYGVDKELLAAKEALEKEMELKKKVRENLIKFISNKKLTHADLNALITRGTRVYDTIFRYLYPEIKTRIEEIVVSNLALDEKRKAILKIFEGK